MADGKLKIAICTPWDNQWIQGFRDAFHPHRVDVIKYNPGKITELLDGFYDAQLLMWSDQWTLAALANSDIPSFVWMRRYEAFMPYWTKFDTSKIAHWFFVNKHFQGTVKRHFGDDCPPTSVVYNGIPSDRWKFKERKAGKNIAMMCHVHAKKNIPMAIQILAGLPEGYNLHIAGDIQDPCVYYYVDHLARSLRRRVTFHGQLPYDFLQSWMKDKHYLLSTSISEGNPNNVIEAMTSGCKPVVHNWPGARDQFPSDCVFNTCEEAVEIITSDEYDSQSYHDFAKARYGPERYRDVAQVVLDALAVKC